jgi:hypothetical protein
LAVRLKADEPPSEWLVPEVVNMDQQNSKVQEGIFVPAVELQRERQRTRYGTLKDLPDEELAEPDELERVVYKEMWWPILRLPQQRWECPIRPNMDEDGRVDWGAFGTVDFESYRPQSSKLLYKAEQMKEELKERVIQLYTISDRIPGRAKWKILQLVRKGILDTDDIEDWDMWQLAVGYVRALRLRREIQRMLVKSRQKREQKAAEFWATRRC